MITEVQAITKNYYLPLPSKRSFNWKILAGESKFAHLICIIIGLQNTRNSQHIMSLNIVEVQNNVS